MWNRGFTLIEMLIVLSILGLLLTMTGTRNAIVIDRSRDAALMIQCQSYRNAIHQFVLETAGRFPETLGELTPKYLPRVSETWSGSRSSGIIHYDKKTGLIRLYNRQGTALDLTPDAGGRPYGDY